MKTTLDLPEDLVRQLKLRAERDGRDVQDLAAGLLAAALGGTRASDDANQPVPRHLPLIKARPLAPADAAISRFDMEKHFLSDMVEGEPTFRAEPWYNPHGDCLIFQMADEAVIADRVDEVLTIYRSAIDNRPIGFQIKAVHAILQTYGWEGLAVCHKTDQDRVKSVSIAAILLAAYERGPRTVNRRCAYAAVMECQTNRTRFSAEELVPA